MWLTAGHASSDSILKILNPISIRVSKLIDFPQTLYFCLISNFPHPLFWIIKSSLYLLKVVRWFPWIWNKMWLNWQRLEEKEWLKNGDRKSLGNVIGNGYHRCYFKPLLGLTRWLGVKPVTEDVEEKLSHGDYHAARSTIRLFGRMVRSESLLSLP